MTFTIWREHWHPEDVATSATPSEVRDLFRNCRIIGRRFKLAHLHFHGNSKILECSTFRQAPSPSENGEDILITRDNEFGTAEEDALRRDFNNGEPERRGDERNYQKYLDRVAELKSSIARAEADLSSLRTEISRLK